MVLTFVRWYQAFSNLTFATGNDTLTCEQSTESGIAPPSSCCIFVLLERPLLTWAMLGYQPNHLCVSRRQRSEPGTMQDHSHAKVGRSWCTDMAYGALDRALWTELSALCLRPQSLSPQVSAFAPAT
eukprot:2339840-Rhodomonas_salina.6